MGAGASTGAAGISGYPSTTHRTPLRVDIQVNAAIADTMTRVASYQTLAVHTDIGKHQSTATAPCPVTDSNARSANGVTVKSFKDKLRPVMLAQKTLKSFAIKNHARENMTYIKTGESVMGSFAIKPAVSAVAVHGASMRKLGIQPAPATTASDSNSTLGIVAKGGGTTTPPGSSTPPKQQQQQPGLGPGLGLKFNLGLKLMLTEDESDWIQVSEDEDDNQLSPRRKKLLLPSMQLQTKQSLMFTNSGTIFVDGFSEGIGKDGIHNNDGSSHFLLSERIVLVCNLGQGASGIVYKALDLQEMRVVAVKCISVFDRGKRRQMVRELGALFEMLHNTEFSPRSASPTPRLPRSTPKTVEFNDIIRRTSIQAEDKLVREKSFKNPKDHIVDFYDAFSNLEDGGVALMMEYMDGGSLQDIADAGGVDDEGTLASIAFQVLSGLNFLHKCNQIHRDIKPANILINHDGLVKVSDLGILKKIDPVDPSGAGKESKKQNRPHLATIESMEIPPSPAATHKGEGGGSSGMSAPSLAPPQTPGQMGSNEGSGYSCKEGEEKKESSSDSGENGTAMNMTIDSTTSSSGKRLNIDDGEMYRANTFVGTVTYMAPERIDSRPYTFNSDVWSFGLTLLTVALGKLPIDNANGFWSVLNAIRDQPPPQLPLGGPWSDELRDFINQCLIKSPSNRPTCEDLLQHCFVKRAVPDNFEEDSVDIEARGKKEVRSIINALHTHLVNLRDDYTKECEKQNCCGAEGGSGSPIVNTQVLAQAIEARGVDEVLQLLVFGREPSVREDITKEENTAHRLGPLAKQLHLSLRETLITAKAVCREILASRVDSHVSVSVDTMMMGVKIPSNGGYVGDIILAPSIENEWEDTVQAPPVTETPKARHDRTHKTATATPTPKARHDLR